MSPKDEIIKAAAKLVQQLVQLGADGGTLESIHDKLLALYHDWAWAAVLVRFPDAKLDVVIDDETSAATGIYYEAGGDFWRRVFIACAADPHN